MRYTGLPHTPMADQMQCETMHNREGNSLGTRNALSERHSFMHTFEVLFRQLALVDCWCHAAVAFVAEVAERIHENRELRGLPLMSKRLSLLWCPQPMHCRNGGQVDRGGRFGQVQRLLWQRLQRQRRRLGGFAAGGIALGWIQLGTHCRSSVAAMLRGAAAGRRGGGGTHAGMRGG